MPATAITAAAALLIHSQITVDSTIGIQHGEAGLIINSLDIMPTRDVTNKTDHKKRKVMSIHANPELKIKIDGEVTVLAGIMSAPHPASCLLLSDVANWYDGINHGFPTDEGYFHIEEPGLKGKQGDLWGTAPTLVLDWLPTDATQVIRAAA